ncbi:MAG TPA: hypothetical protein P5044_11820, partial [bacterium]|nr:hypothetical protein [bacterium]
MKKYFKQNPVTEGGMSENTEKKEIVPATKIAVFKGKEVRKVIYGDEWWFVINDIIEVLTD